MINTDCMTGPERRFWGPDTSWWTPCAKEEPAAVACAWDDTVPLRVPIPANLSHTGKMRWAVKPVDRSIAPIVKALNDAGIYTAGACCGHGKANGQIILHDGRRLEIKAC